MELRDRRGLTGKRQLVSAVAMPEDTVDDKKRRVKKQERREARKGALYYAVFLLIALGLPCYIVIRSTPFFIFQNVRCRLSDHIVSDRAAKGMEAGYAQYFSDPPLYLSDAYNRTVFWGTYEPSHIFTMKSRSDKPVMVGIAWYDALGQHPLRHLMPYTHNKVNAPKSAQKKGRDPEVMQVRWVVHDGLHYGKQTINDAANRLRVNVEFLKSPSGDSWHVRLHGAYEGGKPLDVVVYVVNGDAQEHLEVAAPTAHNDGDWSPLLRGQLRRGTGDNAVQEPFTVRVYDDHNPLYDTAPWRVQGLHIDDVDGAFALTSPEVLGGTISERAKTEGRGISAGRPLKSLQRQHIDLAHLPSTAFTYIDQKDQHTFRAFAPAASGQNGHNVMVLTKQYDASFRLEVSLIPAQYADSQDAQAAQTGKKKGGRVGSLIPRYDSLSTCQLTNAFRRRDKAIHAHVLKIFKPLVGRFNVSGSLYQQLASLTLGEMFGSMSYGVGHYLEADPEVDAAWDRAGQFPENERISAPVGSPSPQVARAWALLGSRTDEPVGQAFLTGLQLPFLIRWNKELVKDVLASWLLDAQNPSTGFIPARATFTAMTRSMTTPSLRREHTAMASPPTLLLGLREYLREVARKGDRVKRASQKKERNRPAYYEREVAADKQFLSLVLPALKRWRQWWHESQCGGLTPELAAACATGSGVPRRPLEQWPTTPTGRPEDQLVYRWHLRDGHRLPASGMEDYFRPVCRTEGGGDAHLLEAHVDAFAWIAMLSQLISDVETNFLHLPESVRVDWAAHLNALHWDAQNQRYADRLGCEGQPFSPYVGYPNLFPVMLGILDAPDADKVVATLKLAQSQLWSAYGLMSASFGSVALAREKGVHHENLFTGPIWPSLNFLFLYGIKTKYIELLGGATDTVHGGALAADLYESLHLQLTETIRTGSRWWEFFNPVYGDGEGSKTYIGTRALLLGMMAYFS